jgi:predicted dithiol-disulfide oxidoreductase (DUF899 family)
MKRTPKRTAGLAPVVSQKEFDKAIARLRVKEKKATRARDALAAERRRLPMTPIETDYVFDGTHGKVKLLDLFEGRPQLLLYHFMFAPDVGGWPDAGCVGCSLFADQVSHQAHFHARDVSMAFVSLAPIKRIERYRKRMGWTIPWYSSAGTTFNRDFNVTTDKGEQHALSVFLNDGKKIYRTYWTTARGCETLGSIWSFLDLLPFGRQETWEDTPKGRPQGKPYQWWKRHDEY